MEGHCAPALSVASAWWKPNGTPTCLPRAGACGRHRDDIYTDCHQLHHLSGTGAASHVAARPA